MIKGIEDLWQELIRRRVVRAAAAYAAVCFVALQLGEILLPVYGGGPSALRTLVAALFAGFPLALAVSWVYDVSAAGLRRTPAGATADSGCPVTVHPLPRRVLAAVMGSAVALGAAGWWLVRGAARTGEIGVSIPSIFVSAAVFAVVGWWSIHDKEPEMSSATEQSSIAVLPFAYWGPSGSQNYMGEALADEIRNLLANVEGLQVTARTSSFTNGDGTTDARHVGRKLGVATLLEGSVLRDDAHLRVTAQLIDTHTGFRIWSKTCACEVDDSLTTHDRIAKSIVDDMLRHGVGTRRVGA